MPRFWFPAAIVFLSLFPSSAIQADDDASAQRGSSFLSLLEPGQTVLVARFQFGFELVIVSPEQPGEDLARNADSHRVIEVGRDYVVLEQGDWEKRIAASAIAVIGRQKSRIETAVRSGEEGALAAVRSDRRNIQGEWKIVSARVSGRDVELPDDVVWTFAGQTFLSGGHFPAAIEDHRDPSRETFELSPRGAATELAHVAFSVRDEEDSRDEEEPGTTLHAINGDNRQEVAADERRAVVDEEPPLSVFRLSVTLKDGQRRKLEGVYSLQGDTLTICLGAQRPATALETADGDGMMLFVLKRVAT